jgi:hypothetical protein
MIQRWDKAVRIFSNRLKFTISFISSSLLSFVAVFSLCDLSSISPVVLPFVYIFFLLMLWRRNELSF